MKKEKSKYSSDVMKNYLEKEPSWLKKTIKILGTLNCVWTLVGFVTVIMVIMMLK